uniref:Uncharacterized protein LOC114330746 n=1 Tax=Diabrotica virgifera virgifera TaxID=50390 RepID=A0A6P7FIN3_DIAVI
MFTKLEELSSLDNLIITGDFNFPEITWPITSLSDTENSHNLFKSFVVNSNLIQLITEPTRFRTNNQPSTLDLVLINDEQLISSLEISSPIGKSDHAVITAHIQFNQILPRKNNIVTYTTTDFSEVDAEFSQINWNLFFADLNDPSSMWTAFLDTVHNIISKNTTHP